MRSAISGKTRSLPFRRVVSVVRRTLARNAVLVAEESDNRVCMRLPDLPWTEWLNGFSLRRARETESTKCLISGPPRRSCWARSRGFSSSWNPRRGLVQDSERTLRYAKCLASSAISSSSTPAAASTSPPVNAGVSWRAPRPADQTFAITLTHTGARVSEALAICPRDVDLEAASIRIRTLKRRVERWREVPVLQDGRRRHRRPPNLSEGSPARLRHRGRRRQRAAPDDRGRPGPRQPADHSGLHHCRGLRGSGFSGQDVGNGGEFGRIWRLKASRDSP